MPNVQTLDELKAENAEAEKKAAEESAPEAAEIEEEAAEETDGETGEIAESGQDEPEEEPVESWMKSENDSGDEKKFDDSDMARLRKKLQSKADAKLDEKDAEIEQLRAQLQQQAPAGQQPSNMPTLEQFEYDEHKYAQALLEWNNQQIDSRIHAANQHTQQTEAVALANAERQRKVSSHYDRAAKLAVEAGIDPEVYQASDYAVRRAVASVDTFKANADTVVDHIISSIGEGSEKVMYYLGRNPSVKAEFVDALNSDQTGVKAAVLLGELKTKLTQPIKQATKASKPAKRAEGDSSGSEAGTNLKRKYDRAKTPQARFDIRREARKAGVNTRDW